MSLYLGGLRLARDACLNHSMKHTTTSTCHVTAGTVDFRWRSDRKQSEAHICSLPLCANLDHTSLDILYTSNVTLIFILALVEEVELHSMTDTAAEPLISGSREYPNDARYNENDAEEVEVDESALVSPGLFIWGLTICAGVSGLLFGYEYVSVCVEDYPTRPTSYNLHVQPSISDTVGLMRVYRANDISV
jgi:hypothetical protein